MTKRAAICIGVNRARGMTPLQAAADGAVQVEKWAQSQGCDTRLLTDEPDRKVRVADVFEAVDEFVQAGTYHQLIIYFSGHGILTAPGTEYWLLSGAPQNPNEAVNLFRSVEDARNCGIPHVVFISDACRSAVQGPPLSGVVGGVIFPNLPIGPQRGEIDVFYATRPGDPAYEVSQAEATGQYRAIFTDALLKALRAPRPELRDVALGPPPLAVITSRGLKQYLEALVPVNAGTVDVRLRQQPEVRVETALPKYFALAPAAPPDQLAEAVAGIKGTFTFDDQFEALPDEAPESNRNPFAVEARTQTERVALAREEQELLNKRGREQFETRTGFTVFGARVAKATAPGWRVDDIFSDPGDPEAFHIRLAREGNQQPVESRPSSLLLEFEDGSGTLLAIVPEFVGTVVVEKERVASVSYRPSHNSRRFAQYQARADELEAMKAAAAVGFRQGRFTVPPEDAHRLARTIRQGKGLDPTLGIYAAYSYAQVGKHADVRSVFEYMVYDVDIPVPFDVVMLVGRYEKRVHELPYLRYAPFAPVLSQGWALLMPDHPLYDPSLHKDLRAYLLPSLWTTYAAGGVRIIEEYFNNQPDK